MLKRLQASMSKVPLDDLVQITFWCNTQKGFKDMYGKEDMASFMEQLSEDILKRRPEKAGSDDEKLLYS